MNNKLISYLYLSIAMLLVGTSVVAGKMISTSLPIFLSTFLGLLVASILFIPQLIPVLRKNILSKQDYLYISLQALLGTVSYRILLLISLKYVDASYAGILSALQPAMISLLAVLLLREKQTVKQILGITLAVIGLALAYSSHTTHISVSSSLFIGTILILLAVLGEAGFSVLAKKVTKKISPITIAGLVTLISCIAMIPFALYDLFFFNIGSMSLYGIGVIAYYGIFLTYISFILWFKGLQHINVSVAGVFTALAPVSGIVLSVLLLGETPNLSEIMGGILIIGSIVLVVYNHEK